MHQLWFLNGTSNYLLRRVAVALEIISMHIYWQNQLDANDYTFAQNKFGCWVLLCQLEVLLYESVDLYRQTKVAT